MTSPADPVAYPTFLDAVLAGAETADLDRMDDWVERWHDDRTEHAELHQALGMSSEELASIVPKGGAKALHDLVAARRAAIDGPQDGPVAFRFGRPAAAQESSFGNATLTVLAGGHAISVAMIPPADLDVSDSRVLRTTLSSMFRRFVDAGWRMEVEVGPSGEGA